MKRIAAGVLRLVFGTGTVAVLVFGIMAAYPRHQESVRLTRQKETITRAIEEKNREIDRVKDKIRRFHTDREFIETLARENRRVYPGELVFVFQDEDRR